MHLLKEGDAPFYKPLCPPCSISVPPWRSEALSMNKIDDRLKEDRKLLVLKKAVENTNEAFVTIDQNHTVVFFNKAAEKIFGYNREEVLGGDLGAILSPKCRKDHREAVDRYLTTRRPKLIGHESELTAVRKNGESFPISISFSVTEVEGHLYFTGILRDLTENKALEERIAKAERLAVLGRLVAEITHEIKNPMMMIGGFARQLLKSTTDASSLNKLDIIVEEVRRLEKLLEELGEYYRPRKLNREAVDINELLEEIFSLAKENCEKNNINIVLYFQKDKILVEADRSKLKQVFLNMVKNGMEAMKEGGDLTIRSLLRGDKVEITFADEGAGIPEEVQEKIFTPFFTTKKHGTGLGLPISKRIIEEHPGSSLSLDSREDQGTMIKITMPVMRA